MRKKTTVYLMAVFFIFFAASTQAASAGLNTSDLFDGILQRFMTAASSWGSKMVDYGTWLFWGLTSISMVWTYGMMALKKSDIGEFLAETVRFLATTGFFLWILRNGPQIAISIVDTLRRVASEASGVGYALSPSGIMDVGFDIFFKVVDGSSVWSPASSIVGLFVAAAILIMLTLVAVSLLLVLISSWIMAYGGVFLLGFGGGQWTQDIAINYYKNVLGIGVQAMAMILLVGIGKSFIDQFYAAISTDLSIKDLAIMLVVSIILLSLIKTIPPMLAGIVSGGGSGGGGGGIGVAGALSGAAMAGAAMSSMAAAAAGAGANMAGGASALKAAFQAAQATMSESSGGGGGLALAMGSASRMAMSMGQHLASGAGELAKEKMSSAKEAIQDKIAGTIGGQIAQAINDKSAGSEEEDSINPTQTAANDSGLDTHFDGDSLGAGAQVQQQSQTSSPNEEVARFVNKSAGDSQGEKDD